MDQQHILMTGGRSHARTPQFDRHRAQHGERLVQATSRPAELVLDSDWAQICKTSGLVASLVYRKHPPHQDRRCREANMCSDLGPFFSELNPMVWFWLLLGLIRLTGSLIYMLNLCIDSDDVYAEEVYSCGKSHPIGTSLCCFEKFGCPYHAPPPQSTASIMYVEPQ